MQTKQMSSSLPFLPVAPLANLKTRTSAKWRDFPDDVLPLPIAEMDYEIALPIREKLIEMISHSDTGYLGTLPELAQSLVHFAQLRWNWDIDSKSVFPATDVGVGVVEMVRMMVQPGDGIVLNSPVYHNIGHWIDELKCNRVDAPLRRDGLNYSLDWDAIERAYASGAKVHILCNPANPVGVIFSREELARLADLAKKYNVVIVSDEIHAPLVYAEGSFTPFLEASESAREIGFTVISASKSWNLAGLKCAQVVTGSERFKKIAESMPPAVLWRASLFGAVAASVAYRCTDWLDAANATNDRSRRYLKELLERELPQVGYRIPDCSYLAWLDLSALNLGANPAERLLKEAKVAFNAGSIFGPGHDQFIRLNFATSEEIIEEAVRRIASLV
jgi:cysteine-S-conjugate beta-lyase